MTGSYNWTSSAEKNNYENFLIFPHSPHLAGMYEKEFEKVWKEAILYSEMSTITRLDFPIISTSDIESLKENARKMVKIRGAVNHVYHSEGSNTFFLHFGPDRSSFSAVIFSSVAKRFVAQGLDPEDYEGKEVEILGQIIDHPEYGLEMILKDPSLITVMSAN